MEPSLWRVFRVVQLLFDEMCLKYLHVFGRSRKETLTLRQATENVNCTRISCVTIYRKSPFTVFVMLLKH
jgi:hypothetical protein